MALRVKNTLIFVIFVLGRVDYFGPLVQLIRNLQGLYQILISFRRLLQQKVPRNKMKKNINPIAALGKSSKKGKKTTTKDFENLMVDDNETPIEPSSSEDQPIRKRLRKAGKKSSDDDQKYIAQKQNSESQYEEQKESEEEEIQYEKFQMAGDQALQEMKDEKKKKKGGKKLKKGEQQIDKFVEKQAKQQKTSKNNGQKPKGQTTQLSLHMMFGDNSRPKKIQPKPQKMDEQKRSASQSEEDDLQIYKRKQKALQQLNAGMSQEEGLKVAMRQSLHQMKDSKKSNSANVPNVANKSVSAPIQSYQYEFFNKNASKNKIQEKPKKQQTKSTTKNDNRKRQKSQGKKKQKQEKPQKTGPLKGLGIVLTGQFEPYTKNKIIQLIEQLGGDTPKSITKKTTHLLQGCYIVNTFGRKTDQDVKTTAKSLQAAQKNVKIIEFEKLDDFFLQKTGKTLEQLMQRNKPARPQNIIQKYIEINKKIPSASKTAIVEEDMSMDIQPNHNQIAKQQKPTNIPRQKYNNITVPWTQKYAPRSSQQIIGQTSQVKSLKQWLSVWEDIHIRGNKRDVKPSFNSFMPSGTINSNAALLSGDAGLGKTTTARLVAAQFGYSIVQYNASDARNKKSVQLISAGKNNLSFTNKIMQKTLIIMDQIDGMSSGDRGGITAIIDMIKKTKVPIICICNDRQSPKIRSLAGHCFDIKYHKPDRRMIVKRLQKIIQMEGGTSTSRALQSIVQLLQNDVRQILTYLQVIFKGGNKNINADLIQKRCSNTKDNSLTVNFFEATKRLMCRTMFKDMTISQRVDLTFVDSDMVPLMVQQNYLSANNKKKLTKQQMRGLVKATQGFVKADIIDKTIMKNQDYCLMPNKMFLSCVYPCEMICENVGFPKFTQWLGKFSSQRKNRRLIKQLKYSLACVSSVTSHSVKHNFAPMLYERICQQLIVAEPDTEKIVQFMLHYGITPAMLTQNLVSLQYGNRQGMYKSIETSKKTRLTKTYNKLCQATKFKKQKVKTVVEHTKFDPVLGEMEEQVEEQQGQEEDKSNDVDDIIVEKKATKAKKKK